METSEQCLKYLQTELANVCRRHPDLNKFVNNCLQQQKSKNLWPEDVFIPSTEWAYYLNLDVNNTSREQDIDLYETFIYGTWRYKQDIYTFNNDLATELYKTGITGRIPIEILSKIPDYSFFLDLSNCDSDVFGVFVQRDCSYRLGVMGISLFILSKNEDERTSIWMPMRKEYTVYDSLNEYIQILKSSMEKKGIEVDDSIEEHQLSFIQGIFSMILYLCSDKPDICNPREPGTSPHRPEPKKVKGGMKLFPAQKPTIWEVGRNIGQALRNAARQPVEYQGGTHASPKAHIRRGHWHGYWTGPRTGKREFTLKWLHPILVNMARDAVE